MVFVLIFVWDRGARGGLRDGVDGAGAVCSGSDFCRQRGWRVLAGRQMMGLVLTRNIGESLVIGGDVRVTVAGCRNKRCTLVTDAPRWMSVHRSELVADAVRSQPVPPENLRAVAIAYELLRMLFPAGVFVDCGSPAAVEKTQVDQLQRVVESAGLPWDLCEPMALRSLGFAHWQSVSRGQMDAMLRHVDYLLGRVAA